MLSKRICTANGARKKTGLCPWASISHQERQEIRKKETPGMPCTCERNALQLQRLNAKNKLGAKKANGRRSRGLLDPMLGTSKLKMEPSCEPTGCAMPHESAIPNEPSLEQFREY